MLRLLWHFQLVIYLITFDILKLTFEGDLSRSFCANHFCMPMEIVHTNEELLLRISQGSEEAFTALYNRFWETLFAIAYNRLKDIQLSEDVVHDVFASLWKNRQNLQIEHIDNYLATAVKYAVLAQIKKKLHAKTYATQTTALHLPESGAEDTIHYRHILEMMQQEINLLPEKCRLIFKYSREKGMSTQQIAQSLHISPKTVDNQIHKALLRLKNKMKHLLSSCFFLF
jgi:RNA polymerase sigma-70 factor (ECF subfamily)